MHKILQTLENLIIKHFAAKKSLAKQVTMNQSYNFVQTRYAQNTAKKCMMFTKGIHKKNNRYEFRFREIKIVR